jgi:hypothetical protein
MRWSCASSVISDSPLLSEAAAWGARSVPEARYLLTFGELAFSHYDTYISGEYRKRSSLLKNALLVEAGARGVRQVSVA